LLELKNMIDKAFPILEFDEDRAAFIRPEAMLSPVEVTPNCVLCFYQEAIQKILGEYAHKVVAYFTAACLEFPLYEVEYKGQKVALMLAAVGAPLAGAQIDELTALGCKKFIACGSCGVLQKEIAVGHLIIPTSAVRDEGTSYHYVQPSREIEADSCVVQTIEETFLEQKVPYIKAKTWTTDAFYRETPAKIQLRKKEGCVTVEMEASAYMAVARYNNVQFGQILTAGDSLAGETWDSRRAVGRAEIQELVLRLAMDASLKL
jgi:uridine phosphorylase